MTRSSGMRGPRMRGRLPLRARPRSTRCSVVLPLGSTRWHLSRPRRCRRRHPALSLARLFTDRGIAVHVVTRGYRGKLRGPVQVDPARHDADAVGDEALLLAAVAPCWVAKDRAPGIAAAVKAGAQAILLDDGFQNPNVGKDLSLVVVDAEYGFGNGRVMPAGPLREPVAAGAGRAAAVAVVG